MIVTKWTYAENNDYIDILYERSKIIGKIYNKYPKIPNMKEYKESGMTEDELEELLDNRRKSIDKDIAESEELKEYDRLIDEICECVKEDIVKNNYHFTGDMHQNYDYGCPVIDDKYKYYLTQRSWGQLMYECYPDEDYSSYGKGYEYLKWSFIKPENVESIYPKEEI